jgi:diguanylate cyclase (GGDEF)-like protein
MQPVYHPGTVALSILIAAFASYVSLDLASRVRAHDRLASAGWVVAGALVMGSGIWAMHFVGMLAMQLPIEIGYRPGVTLLSWAAAVATSALALYIATRDRLDTLLLGGGALAMGAGICAMHYIGMAAIALVPALEIDPQWAGLSVLIACGASAVALKIFFWMRQLHGAQLRLAQGAAALIMGLAIAGMHYSGMAAAHFPAGAVCLSTDGLGGQGLGWWVGSAAAVLLLISLFTAVLDARLSAKAQRLARSLHQANGQLAQVALADPLTGVANRMLLEDRLGHAVDRADRVNEGRPSGLALARLALLFVDLDGFAAINDSFGHGAGDRVLKDMALRLRGCLRDADSVSRVGADQFVLLLEDMAGEADALAVAQRVQEAVGQPVNLGGRPLTLSCSIGIVIYPDHGRRDRLLSHAEAAMHQAKRIGGGGWALFDQAMGADARAQIELQEDLRAGLQRGELLLHYQPKVDASNGQIRSLEALVRWQHPRHGLLGPGQFIPVAERFGLINALGGWVIREACRQLGVWSRQGLRLRVSVNLSVHQVRQGRVVEQIEAALREHGVSAEQLTCEITESVAMEDTAATQAMLAGLARAGVKLSIDDFGTGYSSLAYLKRFAVDKLKIDQSFVRDLARNTEDAAIVRAIIQMAASLGLRTIAEGVEDAQTLDALRRYGCDEVQGYYLAKPLPVELFAQFVLEPSAAGGTMLAATASATLMPSTPAESIPPA